MRVLSSKIQKKYSLMFRSSPDFEQKQYIFWSYQPGTNASTLYEWKLYPDTIRKCWFSTTRLLLKISINNETLRTAGPDLRHSPWLGKAARDDVSCLGQLTCP